MFNFVMKQMLKRQLSALPAEQQEKVMKVFEENPQLILQLAQEVQAELKSGKSQEQALMAVMEKHKDTLKDVLA